MVRETKRCVTEEQSKRLCSCFFAKAGCFGRGKAVSRYSSRQISKCSLEYEVNGLIHVLDELTTLDWETGTSKGIMPFQEAYEMYLSAFNLEVPAPDRYNFRDELLSIEYGLPVTLFQWEDKSYIVLNPERWNIVRLLDVFCNKNVEKVKRFDLNATSLKTIIDSTESEYDKSVLRGILAATSTRSELYDLGLKIAKCIGSV